jgi:hypothetical protein
MTTRIICVIFMGLLLLSGCRKKDLPADCEGLRYAMEINDVNGGKTALATFISQLSSTEHTDSNLDQLVLLLNDNCSVIAEKLCFGCIQTLPEQSEIRIHFINNGTLTERTFDISRPGNGSNMIVLNMHD